jgi:hypothetical protein
MTLGLAVAAARNRGRWIDHVVRSLCVAGVEHAQRQRVVAIATDVDARDRTGPTVGERCQLEMQSRAVERQRIGAAPAIGKEEIKRRDAHDIVARSALEGVRAAIADQRVVAGSADEGLSRCAAGQRVIARRAWMRDRAGEFAAEHP